MIFHGSTKFDDDETIGQYGSGFVTTHLLSPEIRISGTLEDGRPFDFPLRREAVSVESLRKSMDESWNSFNNSLDSPSGSPILPDDYTTEFRYSIDESSEDAVEEGILTLKHSAPYVVAFNAQFRRLDVISSFDTLSFEVVERDLLDNDLHGITVKEGSARNYKKYILAEGKRASVAIPLQSAGDEFKCLSIADTPKLFKGFPLIGTEGFSFPAVVNSLEFTPTENRDGVPLWLNAGDSVNRSNQAAIADASSLLIKLIRFAASSHWQNIHLLADIPSIRPRDWLDESQLRQHTDGHVVSPIIQTPAVLPEHDVRPMTLSSSIIPYATNDSSVQSLWDLLHEIADFQSRLPRRREANGWCNAVKSWANVREVEATGIVGTVVDGRQLALIIEGNSKTHSDGSRERFVQLSTTQPRKWGSVAKLQNHLSSDITAIEWLDKFFGFLKDNGLENVVRGTYFVPDQAGHIDKLTNLYRDDGIDSELKDMAEDLGLGLRKRLRDNRLSSLDNEIGKGDYGNKQVVQEIIQELKKLGSESILKDQFLSCSVRLFAWIVDREDWDYLQAFPMFSERQGRGNGRPSVIYIGMMPGADGNSDVPLAPYKTWTKDLQGFSELFPRSSTLAQDYYDAVPNPSVWETLVKKGFISTNVIITRTAKMSKFYPDLDYPFEDEITHTTKDPVSATDIVRRGEIMSQVRDSRSRAYLLWRFLSEWLVRKDDLGLEIKTAECECGHCHDYYPAAWLESLRDTNWIRRKNRDIRDNATARSLASLLRDNDWVASSLKEDSEIVRLLDAVDVTRFDLMRESMVENDTERDAIDGKFINIMTAAQGNTQLLDRIPQFLENLKNDPNLPTYIEERLKQRDVVQRNQQLGGLVEELVRGNLESEGFSVKRTGIGSDFEIEYDFVQKDEKQEIGLELKRDNQSWLVEVKATRDNDARMTPTQARNAVKEGDRFLLCVVPLQNAVEPTVENVRANMRFVEDIGDHVSSLCDALDDFEQQRTDITADYGDGFQLVVMSGTTRIRVDKSAWEEKGFCLSKLRARLK